MLMSIISRITNSLRAPQTPSRIRIGHARDIKLSESVKGKTKLGETKRTHDIGEDHPCDFELLEEVYKNVPLASGAINKTVDVTVSSDFSVKSKNPTAEKIINEFMKKHNFDLLLRNIVKDLMIFGNCFVEVVYSDINQKIKQLRILNAESMYVTRNEYGEVEGYTQLYKNEQEPIKFTNSEIIHFKYNVIGDCAYGYSIIAPTIKIMENKLQMEQAMMTLMKRKANAPLVVTMGTENDPAQQTDLDGMANDLYHLDEKTEWVVDHRVNISSLDVGGKIANFGPFNEHFENQLVYALEVPIVLLGRGNIPEGLATTQLEAFERRVNSIRLLVENVLEQNLFNRVLLAYNLTADVEFEWEPQTNEDRWREAERIMLIMSTGQISEPSRKALEDKLNKIMGIEGVVPEDLPRPENNRLSAEPQQGPGPSPPGPNTPTRDHNPYKEHLHETWPTTSHENMTIKEWTSRETNPLWPKIDGFLDDYDFGQITGLTKADKKAMKIALKTGIKKNMTLKQLTQHINKVVDDPNKAERIARTETVRAVSRALLEDFKEAGAQTYRWVTISDLRRCPECAELHGRQYGINSNGPLPPFHPNCRCTITAVF